MLIDTSLLQPEAISDETHAFNKELQGRLLALPPITDFEPTYIRQQRSLGAEPWGPIIHSDHARTRQVPGGERPVALRIVDSGTADGIYLHFHGGGFVLGAADHNDPMLEGMSRNAGVISLSVEYRLAPEHPYPAGLNDCVAATRWLIEHAAEEFGTDRIVIGGGSAGANLAAATMLRIRDEDGFDDWAGANLVYGVFKLHGTPSVKNWTKKGLILDREAMQWFGKHYSAGQRMDPTDPYINPLFGELKGLGQALFTVGTLDPLLDDTLFMAARWAAAGNPTELHIAPGGLHGFDSFDIAVARKARSNTHRFVREAVRNGSVQEA